MGTKAAQILRDLISVIDNWMEYMQLVMHTPKVLSEHSICIPISDYLERKKDIKFELEKLHKELAKKRVDVYWSCNQEDFYIELKLASGYSSETLSDYYDDLCRLSLLSAPNTHCYFLLSGNYENFNSTFYDAKHKKIQKRKIFKWLSLDSPESSKSECTIYTRTGLLDNKIRTNERKIIDCFDAFIREYDQAYAKRHNNTSLINDIKPFKTKLVYFNNQDRKNRTKNSIAVWEIMKI